MEVTCLVKPGKGLAQPTPNDFSPNKVFPNEVSPIEVSPNGVCQKGKKNCKKKSFVKNVKTPKVY